MFWADFDNFWTDFGLILATYPEAALDGAINIRSGTKRQIDAPSDRPLEHQIGTRNQIEKIDQTPDRQILSDRPGKDDKRTCIIAPSKSRLGLPRWDMLGSCQGGTCSGHAKVGHARDMLVCLCVPLGCSLGSVATLPRSPPDMAAACRGVDSQDLATILDPFRVIFDDLV